MSISVERSNFDPDQGRYHYYVALKQDVVRDDPEVQKRVPVQVALSISETGELVDLAFELPKQYRNDDAIVFVKRVDSANCVADRIFITVPGLSGDTVINAPASLDLDGAGRIIGLEIH
jgi:hypothetical protein